MEEKNSKWSGDRMVDLLLEYMLRLECGSMHPREELYSGSGLVSVPSGTAGRVMLGSEKTKDHFKEAFALWISRLLPEERVFVDCGISMVMDPDDPLQHRYVEPDIITAAAEGERLRITGLYDLELCPGGKGQLETDLAVRSNILWDMTEEAYELRLDSLLLSGSELAGRELTVDDDAEYSTWILASSHDPGQRAARMKELSLKVKELSDDSHSPVYLLTEGYIDPWYEIRGFSPKSVQGSVRSAAEACDGERTCSDLVSAAAGLGIAPNRPVWQKILRHIVRAEDETDPAGFFRGALRRRKSALRAMLDHFGIREDMVGDGVDLLLFPVSEDTDVRELLMLADALDLSDWEMSSETQGTLSDALDLSEWEISPETQGSLGGDPGSVCSESAPSGSVRSDNVPSEGARSDEAGESAGSEEQRLSTLVRVLNLRHSRDLEIFKELYAMQAGDADGSEWAAAALWNSIGSLEWKLHMLDRGEFTDEEWSYLLAHRDQELRSEGLFDEKDRHSADPGRTLRAGGLRFEAFDVPWGLSEALRERASAANGGTGFTKKQIQEIAYQILQGGPVRVPSADERVYTRGYTVFDEASVEIICAAGLRWAAGSASAELMFYPVRTGEPFVRAVTGFCGLLRDGAVCMNVDDPERDYKTYAMHIQPRLIRAAVPACDEILHRALRAAGLIPHGRISGAMRDIKNGAVCDCRYYEWKEK